jgi:transposase
MLMPGNARLFLYQGSISMHKSFDGLIAAIEEAFPGQLLSGSYFIFLSRTRDRMKVLYWDIDGFVIWYKRLEKGTFATRKESSMCRRDFLLLLEGVVPKKIQPRYTLS